MRNSPNSGGKIGISDCEIGIDIIAVKFVFLVYTCSFYKT